MSLIVSENDKRTYKFVHLDNKLTALLVHAPDADKAAAAMDVRVGYTRDPRGTAGLAHFCEHMLFLGTGKYPDESEHGKYLAAHGGRNNAYTTAESTNYFFDVSWEHLDGALDRFSQFFIDPLFTDSATNREVDAVDSEHSKNLQMDSWRGTRILDSLISPSHPLSRFGTGSKETLSIHADIRDQVVNFWKTYYSANIMKLVVLGRESLEDLEKMVVEKFSPIVNKNLEPLSTTANVYEQGFLPKRVSVVPVKTLRNLNLQWVLPSHRADFRKRSSTFLSHLIGHEGVGSLLSWLKANHWASALLSGPDEKIGYCAFQISIELTENGAKHIDEIVDSVYAYLALVRKHGISKQLYDEVSLLSEMGFRFKDEEEPFSYVSEVASAMQQYPEEYVLFGSRVCDQFDPEQIAQCLDLMVPENMLITVFDPDFKKVADSPFAPNSVEKHYGVEYKLDAVDKERLNKMNEILKMDAEQIAASYQGLHIPHPNPFMPEDLNLRAHDPEKSPQGFPEIIIDTPILRVWHKQDQTFKTPKAVICIEGYSPEAYTSPLAAAKSKVLFDLLSDDLNEFGYDAEIAGLKYSLSNTIDGFTIQITGYNCKQILLLEKMVQRFRTLKINRERFEAVKERAKKTWMNNDFGAPYSIANYRMSLFMEHARWFYGQYIDVLDKITPESIEAWIPQLFDHLYLEMLIMGNVNTQEAKAIANTVETHLKPEPQMDGQYRPMRYVKLDSAQQYWYQLPAPNPEEPNSAIMNYYQIGPYNPKTSLLVDLLNQMISTHVFDVLRTKETLGYIVASLPRGNCNVDGWAVIVQSQKADPVYLDERIEALLSTIHDFLASVPEEEFEHHRLSLIAEKLEKHRSLKKEAVRYWGHINAPHDYNFGLNVQEAEMLQTTTLQDIIQLWDTYFAPKAPKRAKFSSQLWAKGQTPKVPENPETPIKVVEDPFEFKTTMPLHPSLPMGKPRVKATKQNASAQQ